jgi:hypothetical protein
MLLKSGVLFASTALAQFNGDLSLFSSMDSAPEGCDPLPTEAQWAKLSRRQQYNYVKSARQANQNGDICYPNALTFWQLKNVKGICMVIPQIECRNERSRMWKPEDHALGNNEWDSSSYSWCCEADAENCVLNMMVCQSIIEHTAGIQPNIPRLPDMFQRTAQGVQSAHSELDEPDLKHINLNDLDNILLLPRGLTYHMFVQVWGEHLEDFRSASNCPPGGCTVMFPIQPLMNYGCWCNLQSGDLTTGAGLPQDSFDEKCGNFQLCLRCARWDAKQDGTYTCDPVNDGYVGVGNSNFVIDCDAQNPTDCGAHLCMCYTNFFASLVGFLWNPPAAPYDASRAHPGNLYNPAGTFDYDGVCKGGPGNGANDMDCCGLYPERYPFSTNNKGCCGNEIFNPIAKCCDGTATTGNIQPVGTC